ncbi:MAG TPA: class I SAM-dependent methyltransferase, partial [Flavobacteriaceae bacterium]|nr:class I SAM-dependent methyltransferase [Flavobacteriaceae bacterium]
AKSNSWEIFGTEPNKAARKIANEKGIKLERKTESFPDKRFDVISMWHVLEHIPNLEGQIKELDRLLKKDGTLFIAVPNFKSYDAKHYKEFWAAYDVPRHIWHFSRKGIVKIFENFGFEIQETVPLKFDAYYVSLLSEKYKNGRSRFFKALSIGLISNWNAKTTNEYSSHVYILKRK